MAKLFLIRYLMQISKAQLPFNPNHDFLSIVTYPALGHATRECPQFGLRRARCVSWLARTLPTFCGAMQLGELGCVGRSWNQKEGLLGKDVQ